MTFDLKQIEKVTGLHLEDTSIFNEDDRLIFDGEDKDECITWLRGYVKGNLDGIRETIDKFDVEVVPD